MATDPSLATGMLKRVGALWREGEFTDLTVTIKDCQFYCHKFHLCACSGLFKSLIRGKKTGGAKVCVNQVKIGGISSVIFGLVLKAVYKGENCVDENNMIQIWHAAHELQIDVLVSKCEDFVMAHMTLDNYENIFECSVLLESTRVTNFAIEFMAKNFERISQTSLFLDLPAKFLIQIVSSDALVFNSRDKLADSILFWASHDYEPDDGDDDDYSDDATLVFNVDEPYPVAHISENFSDLEAGDQEPISTSTDPETDIDLEGDKQCVEIILSQPPVGLKDESSRRKLRQILQETERREESLGKLLNVAKMERTSPDYLTTLINNDLLMGNKQTRNFVLKAAVSQAISRASSDADVVEEFSCDNLCEDVFVYKLKDTNTILAYRRSTGKRYSLSSDTDKYFQFVRPTYRKVPTILQGQETFRIGEAELVPGDLLEGGTHPVVVGKFLYCFKGSGVYRTAKLTEENRTWYYIRELQVDGNLKSIAVFENEIVLLYDVSRETDWDVNEYTNIYTEDTMDVYSFNTSDMTFKHTGQTKSRPFSEHNEIIFYHNDQLKIIHSSGGMWSVDLSADPCRGLTEYEKKLWSFSVKLYGVTVWQKELIIFADLPADQILPRYSEDLALPMSFVQTVPAGGCYHIKIPECWLVAEV